MKKLIAATIVVYLFLDLLLFRHVLQSGYYLAYDFLSGCLPRQFEYIGNLVWWDKWIMGGVYCTMLQYFQPLIGLAYLCPAPYGSIVLISMHVFLTGIGMFFFLKRFVGIKAASAGGMFWMFTGVIVTLVAAGHDGKIMVMSYFPWLLWCIDNIVESNKWRWAVVVGVIGGLAANTFHTQMCYYVVVFCLIYYLFRVTKRSIPKILLALCIAGIMYLPLYYSANQVVKTSTRAAGRSYERAISYSMPPEEVFCVADPTIQGELNQYKGRRGLKQHTEYVGVLVCILAIIGLFVKSRLKWPLIVVGGTALVIALGGYTPIYRLIYHIPPNGMFRSPAMAFFGFSFMICSLAAVVLKRFPWWSIPLICCLTFMDLYTAETKYIQPVRYEQVFGDTEDIIAYLKGYPGDYRVFPADNEINDNRWGHFGIKSIGGYYPLLRKAFADSVGIQPGSIMPDYHRINSVQACKNLNIRYIITRRDLTGLGVINVFTGQYYKIWEVR
jgi:hypothetical protein